MGPRRLALGLGGVALAAVVLYMIYHAALRPPIMLPLVMGVIELAVFRPRWALYITAAALPLLGRLAESLLYPYFFPAELLTLGLIAGGLIHWALRPELAWRNSSLGVWMIALCAVVLVSMIVELNSNETLLEGPTAFLGKSVLFLTNYFTASFHEANPLFQVRAAISLMEGLVLFLMVIQLIETPEHRNRLADILVIVGSGTATYGIFQYAFAIDLHLTYYARSTLSDRNNFTSYLVLILALCLGQWMGGGNKKRLYFSVIFGLLLLCLVGAASRASWVAGAFVLTAYGLSPLQFMPRRRRWRVATFAFLGGLALLGGLVFAATKVGVRKPEQVPTVRFWYSLNPHTPLTRNLNRLSHWSAAMDAFVSKPVWGIGLGRFYVSDFIRNRLGRPENAHNYFFQVAAELGLLGLIAWLGILGRWFQLTWRQYRAATGESERWTLFGILVGITAYLITCLTDGPLLRTEQQLIFWCVMGLGATVHPGEKLTTRQKLWLLGLGVLLLASVPFRHPLPWPQSLR